MRCADCGKTVYSTAFACPRCGGERFTEGKEQQSQASRSRNTAFHRCADCGAEIPWGLGACPRCGGENMLRGRKSAASVQEQPTQAEHSAPPLEVPHEPASAKQPDATAKRRRVCRKCGWKLGKADETCAWCGSAEFYEEVFDAVTLKFRPVSAPVSQNDEAQEAPASVADNPADGPDESGESSKNGAVSRSAPSEARRPVRATQQKYCADCGKKIPRGSDACPRCGGTRLGEGLDAILHQRRCGDCGKDVPGESEYCTSCFSQNIITGIPPAGYTLEWE